MKKYQSFSILSWIILLLSAALLSYLLRSSQLVPSRMWIIALILFGVVLLMTALLVLKRDSKFLNILGGVLSLLLCAAFIYASVFVVRTVNVAQGLTQTKTQVTAMCVYMNAEDTDDSAALTANMRYGILEQQDRSYTDEVIDILQKDLGAELNVTEYAGVADLLNALFNHDVDAIIMNSALLNLVDETEGFEDVATRVREVRKTHIEREVTVEAPQAKPKKDKKTDLPIDKTPEPENRTFTVYISGIDNRGPLIEKSRSDVNVIAVVNPDTHQILLVTTPRDYYVPLVFPDFTSSRDKLTHAGIYGVQVSMDTLSALYDINLDYYFRVNFDGFIDIVEAMGGITVDVEEDMGTTEYFYPAGPNYLNGYKALSFVRNRFGIGDQQRGKNHMSFIKGVIDKATSTDMLLNFNSILDSVEGCFETSMPYDVISELVREQLDTKAEWNVVMYAVTGTGNSAVPYSLNFEVYVLDPDYTTVDIAKDLMQQVYDGKTISAP